MASGQHASGQARRTPLYDRHKAMGARMTVFAGWEMPLQYEGIIAEHEAVRGDAGLFDVSHLGRVLLHGADAAAVLRSVSTYDTAEVAPGFAHYTLYCNEAGGIEDDVMVYRLEPERWLVVHNAANAAKDEARLRSALGGEASLEEVTAETAMLACQGPRAMEILARSLGEQLTRLPRHGCMEMDWRGVRLVVARTGYTGEDGAEVACPAEAAPELWDELLAAGAKPAGLGARDTLRLEAALPLYGNDLLPDRNPYEAGLGWAVSLDDGAPFTGREELVRLSQQPPSVRLSCLRTQERSVLRHGYAVSPPGSSRIIGLLSSGGFSPVLRKGIGMAYLPPEFASPGTPVLVEAHGKLLPAEVVRRPFYTRPKAAA